MIRLRHRDLAPSAALLGAGGYALWEALDMTTFGAVFPMLAGGGMVLGGLALAARAVLFVPEVPAPVGTVSRPLLLLATLLLWAILLPITGFVPTSAVAVLVVMAIAQQDSAPINTLLLQAAALIALVGIVAVVFGTLLNVPLP